MKAGRGLTVRRMAQLGHISRASLYRFDENAAPGHNADMELRDANDQLSSTSGWVHDLNCSQIDFLTKGGYYEYSCLLFLDYANGGILSDPYDRIQQLVAGRR